MATEENSPSSTSRSRQERVRENQRRSRARRQEHLADLERRLNECQVACREADMLRTALRDVQIENGRLRELLSFAGFTADTIDTHLQQDLRRQTPGSVGQQRRIKPKIVPSTTSDTSSSHGTTTHIPSSYTSVFQTSHNDILAQNPHTLHDLHAIASDATLSFDMSDLSLEWLFSSQPSIPVSTQPENNSGFPIDEYMSSTPKHGSETVYHTLEHDIDVIPHQQMMQ